MLEPVFYATTRETLENGKTIEHHYTVSASDPAPEGHEIISLRPARKFPVNSLVSDENARALWERFGKKNNRKPRVTHEPGLVNAVFETR